MKKVATVILILLPLLAGIATAALAQPIPSRTTAPPSEPFEYGFSVEYVRWIESRGNLSVVEVGVSYYGTYTLLGVEVTLKTACNAEILSPQPIRLGSWRSGTVKSFRFTVNSSQLQEKCVVHMNIHWRQAWDEAERELKESYSGSAQLDVDLRYCGPESIAVSVDPQTLYMGAVNTVRVVFSNNGDYPVDDLTATVNAQGLSIINTRFPVEIAVSRLDPGESKSFTLQVVPQSAYSSMSISISYTNCMGEDVMKTVNVPMIGSTGQSLVVVPEPSKVNAGMSSKVNLRVANLGNIPMRDLRLILTFQRSTLAVSPTILYVGDLNPGQEKRVQVEVDVPATASAGETIAYQATFLTEGGSLSTITGSFTIFVLQTSSLTITSVEAVPERPEVGKTVIFAVNVINDGNFPVYGVNISATPDEGLKPVRSTYNFLGQLNPQVITSVPFSFRVVKPGIREVVFTITYRDAYGNTHSVERRAAVIAENPAASGHSGNSEPGGVGLYAVAVSAVVAALAALVYYRRVKGR